MVHKIEWKTHESAFRKIKAEEVRPKSGLNAPERVNQSMYTAAAD
jgi:hypothetical protein